MTIPISKSLSSPSAEDLLSKIAILCPFFKFKFPSTAEPIFLSLVMPFNRYDAQAPVVKRKSLLNNPELQMCLLFSCNEAI